MEQIEKARHGVADRMIHFTFGSGFVYFVDFFTFMIGLLVEVNKYSWILLFFECSRQT